eukprot:6367985-Amphidinium_carterae.1
MQPAVCGISTRDPTPSEVARCLRRQPSPPDPVGSPWPLALLVVAGSLAFIVAAFIFPSSWCNSRPRSPGPEDVEQQQLELAQPLLEDSSPGQQGLPAFADHASHPFNIECEEEYLSISTVKKGQHVRVTSKPDVLRSACCAKTLPTDERLEFIGERGVVLTVEIIDHLAWVAFKTKNRQGWVPLACLQASSGDTWHEASYFKPLGESFHKEGFIDLSEGMFSPV